MKVDNILNEDRKEVVPFGDIAINEPFFDSERNKCVRINEVKDRQGNRFNAINFTRRNLAYYQRDENVAVVS